jgi:hypothetical protein
MQFAVLILTLAGCSNVKRWLNSDGITLLHDLELMCKFVFTLAIGWYLLSLLQAMAIEIVCKLRL